MNTADPLADPSLADAARFAASGRGTLTADGIYLIWRAYTDAGPVTRRWTFTSARRAQDRLAEMKARVHLNPKDQAA